MQSFRWSSGYAVYVPRIDEEHRNLFRIAGDLQRSVLDNANTGSIRSAFRNLMSHAEEHFEYEEGLMSSTRYPAYAWHKRQHNTARAKALELERRIRSGDREAVLLLLEFLATWLKGHTRLADQMMGAYVRNYEREHAAIAS